MEILQLILTIFVITLLEASLSIDNAAVLAVIVNKKLQGDERNKALKYGIWGAIIFRGLCLFLVAWIINNPVVGDWFKVIGGLYLLKLAYSGFTSEKDSIEDGNVKWYEKWLEKIKISPFWSTVIVVEFVDIVFSLDNLVAVVGMSKNIWVICIGVFIGIFIMRYIASKFSVLMEKFPSLEKSAFIVIALLGLKLLVTAIAAHVGFMKPIHDAFEKHSTDFIFSGIMMAIFFLPMLFVKKKEVGIQTIDPETGNFTRKINY